MWKLNLDRVRARLADADTEELLDRLTVYRDEMEPEALPLVDEELRRRGVSPDEVEAHARKRRDILHDSSGHPVRCQRCARPAVVCRWGWHRLWRVLPVFPRRQALCEVHRPDPPPAPEG